MTKTDGGVAARVAGALLLAGALVMTACTPVGGPGAPAAPGTPGASGSPGAAGGTGPQAGAAAPAKTPTPPPTTQPAGPVVPPPGTLATPEALPPPPARAAGAVRAKAAPPVRRGKAIPDVPVTIDARCAQKERDGYREDARLRVVDGDVQLLAWNLWVGERGRCSFQAAQFKQTKLRPHAELQALDGGGCRLMIWQTPDRITLAHADCARYCVGGVYEQAWPVLFDLAKGGCATGAR